jgi:hypothetical protein
VYTAAAVRLACLALLALLWLHFASTLPQVWDVQVNDFEAYHEAARLVRSGRAAELYRPGGQWFTNLPVVALVLAPLGGLGYADAWRVLWWLELASFAATFALLLAGIARHLGPLSAPRALAAGAVFLCFAPLLRHCLDLGQTTPLAVLLLAGVWCLLRAGRPRTAGLVLGGLCLLKIPPLLLLPVFALRRRLAVCATALAVVAAGVLASWALFGSELLGQWAERVVVGNLGRAQAAFNNRGLDGAFMRLLTDRPLLDWDTVPRPPAVGAAVAGTALALLGLLWWRGGRALAWPRRPPDDSDPRCGSLELELSLGVALMLLVFPIVWIHYYLFLAVPLTLLPFWWLQRGLPLRPAPLLLLALGTWLASGSDVPPNRHYGAHARDPVFRARQSAQTVGALLLVLGLSAPLAELARRERGATRGSRD